MRCLEAGAGVFGSGLVAGAGVRGGKGSRKFAETALGVGKGECASNRAGVVVSGTTRACMTGVAGSETR